jgi:plastocyanin
MIMFWLGRRLAVALAAVVALLLVGGAILGGRGIAATMPQAAVTIDDFAFGPGTITVKRGTTVTWTNKDDDAHTVVSAADPKLWKSPALDTDDHFSFTFNDPGTYKYICSVHPRMQGTVVVE